MSRSQREWPREWLMTDERMGDRLWEAIGRLPAERAGVVVRHYRLDRTERAALAEQIAAICRDRALTLGVAADRELALRLSADLIHNPREPTAELPFSRSVHSVGEANAARRAGAALVFVSSVRATRSHPGQKPLGKVRAERIASAAGVPAIALGGMSRHAFTEMGEAFYGWAGIDAWLGEVRT